MKTFRQFNEEVSQAAKDAGRRKFHHVLRHGTTDEVSKHTGYPKCCVQAFDRGEVSAKSKMNATRKHFHNTGYIPCDHCAKHKTGPELEAEIKKRRQSKVPFPHL